MSKLTLIYTSAIIATVFTPTQSDALKTAEILAAFSGLTECDGSRIAEEVCKKNCKGDGILAKGTCSEQVIWDQCHLICRKDWIEDCVKTAMTRNLEGLPKCR